MVPKLLLRVSVRGLHNSLASDPNNGGIKKERYKENNIIIRNSTLLTFWPPQLKQVSALYKVMCCYECCIYAKIIHASLLYWRDCYLKKTQRSKPKSSKQKAW